MSSKFTNRWVVVRLSGYCPMVSWQRSQRDFCFRSQLVHLHEHCVQSQDSEITFASRSKICPTRAENISVVRDSRWSQLFVGFCLGSLDMQPSPGQCDRSELGEEKLLKSHHSGLWTGSASAQGAHSQLNPCSDATLQLEPSHRALKIFSTFICNINSWYWLQEQYSACINTLKGHYT